MVGHTPRPPYGQTGALIVACLAACGEPEKDAFRYVTEKAEITYSNALCAGDLAHIDETLLRIEEDLDAPLADRVRIHIATEFPVPGCTHAASGCWSPDAGVRTLWQSLDHELVHAVAVRLSDSLAPFWNEGLAETFNGERTQRGEIGVLENLDLGTGEVNYFTAGHFVRWLLETRGLPAMRRIARGVSFEAVYEIPIEEAAAEYEAAPWSYPAFVPCDHPPLQVDGVETVSEEIEIACDLEGSTAFGFGWGPGIARRLNLAEDGTYELRLVGGAGVSFCACQTEILDAPPADDFIGDVIFETVGFKTGTTFESDETHVVDLRAGSYRVLPMIDFEADGETVRFELRRIGD